MSLKSLIQGITTRVTPIEDGENAVFENGKTSVSVVHLNSGRFEVLQEGVGKPLYVGNDADKASEATQKALGE